MTYKTTYNKATLEVQAKSTRQAMRLFKKHYGFYPEYVEPTIKFKDSKRHLLDALRHERSIHDFSESY